MPHRAQEAPIKEQSSPREGRRPLSLRPIREDDPAEMAFLLDLYASSREEELALVSWGEGEQEAFLQMQFWAQHRSYKENYPGAEFLIIEMSGETIGRLYLHRRSDEIRIMDISLMPAWRNLGIGSQLLGDVLDEGRRSSRRVSIHVEIFNPARRLYERLGMRPVADRGVYLLMEWQPPQSPVDRDRSKE